MKYTKLTYLIPVGLLAMAAACGPSAGTVEKKSESTTQTSEGTVKTTTESTQVGTTMEATSETKADTPSGTVTSKTETVVGTVTTFTPGKELEVMTGDKTMHKFDLDEKNYIYTVEGTLAVGKHVTVIHETGDDKIHRVTVRLDS